MMKKLATQTSGVADRYFSKHQQAHQNPQTFGWVKATRPDAIEYTVGPAGMRGLMFFIGVFACIVFIPFGLWASTGLLRHEDLDSFERIMAFLFLLFPIASIGFLLFAVRFEFFRPEDEPTIFDRKNHKIYRVSREIYPGIKGLFKPWPLRYETYDWGLIDAQHHTAIVTTGSTVTRYHSLLFLVRKSTTDPTHVDQFTIGSSLVLGEQAVAPLWEHIRRFMEEEGPPLPSQDQLADPFRPQGWWQSMKAIFPKSSEIPFGTWLRQEMPLVLLLVALLPLTLPMYILWGTGNWLSHKTATPIQWPEDVLKAVGDPILVT